MARYDKGSMLLNLIMSKKGDSSSQQVRPILREEATHLTHQMETSNMSSLCCERMTTILWLLNLCCSSVHEHSNCTVILRNG